MVQIPKKKLKLALTNFKALVVPIVQSRIGVLQGYKDIMHNGTMPTIDGSNCGAYYKLNLAFGGQRIKNVTIEKLKLSLQNNLPVIDQVKIDFIDSLISYFSTTSVSSFLETGPFSLKKAEADVRKKLVGYEGEIVKVLFDYGYVRPDMNVRKDLGLKTCPYCNLKKLVEDDSAEKGFDMDHFFHRANHELLGLCFFNLIPSCKTCNQTYKGTKEFNPRTHIHPYVNEFGEMATFSIGLNKITQKDEIQIKQNCNSGQAIYHKIFGEGGQKGSVKDMGLKRRYKSELTEALLLKNIMDNNHPEYLGSLRSHLAKTGGTEKGFYRHYIARGKELSPSRHSENTMSKFYHDIYLYLKKINRHFSS